ncbi:hypothetical protein [Streptomyces sp. XD-27]|uniref:hypothetical protein n=1 Tax=Streptomyces sp. XD-27 TaxID=3062779 RepID=UPI0026F43501|nr:hypothetical protein [Streptomyces sp. XD-27]WKX71839.1 hypothetical protein Q3Y56_19775 [Streptomyces sp. XD-27]
MTTPPPAGPTPYPPGSGYPQAYPQSSGYPQASGYPPSNGHPQPYPANTGYPQPYPPATGHPYPAPPSPEPPRNRRAVVAGVVALVLVLIGGALTAWWLTRDEDGDAPAARPRVEDSSAPAARPRVKDEKAGISYAIPEGWKRDKGDLIDAFTTAIGKKGSHGEGASVMAGRTGGIPQPRLRYETERAASSNAEYFCPDSKTTPQETKATTVSGRPAHTAVLKVTHPDCGTLYLRMTVVSVDDSRSAFLLGLSPQQGRDEVDAVLKDASLL